ncbi:MAG: Asp-tRNA(Asn)/Glu-tRNA(Gln) amidotransferase subunit GatC [Candidatus Peregrinibacteria bacterium]
MLNEDEVRHIAKLARIALTDDEVKKFSGQLSKVLDYMGILNELDTGAVSETSQVTGMTNVMEKDEVKKSKCKREKLLECTELSIDSNQIRVKNAIK